MRKLMIPIVFATLLLFAAFGALRAVVGQVPSNQGEQVVLSSETQAENTREISVPAGAVPDQPTIGFIESPTAACVQPNPAKDECFINWYYMSVSADPSYVISMTVKLNELGYVGRYNGFFQTSMYIPFNMNQEGFKVACGAPGAGGDPDWGASYAYTIQARASDGLKSGNYGKVICPPYTP